MFLSLPIILTALVPDTVDRSVESSEISCLNTTYLVSHDRKAPDVKHKMHNYWFLTSPEECQELCTGEDMCRSVLHTINKTKSHSCHTYNISLQELIDAGKQKEDEIQYEGDNITFPTFITYDRGCECPAGREPRESTSKHGKLSCQRCSAGFFKPLAGSGMCSECVDGDVSDDKASCRPNCKVNEVASNGTDPCICSVGYERSKTDNQCQKCHDKYFKPQIGNIPCMPCPPNTAGIKPRAIRCEGRGGMEVVGVVMSCLMALTAVVVSVTGFLVVRILWKRSQQSRVRTTKEENHKGDNDDVSDEGNEENGMDEDS